MTFGPLGSMVGHVRVWRAGNIDGHGKRSRNRPFPQATAPHTLSTIDLEVCVGHLPDLLLPVELAARGRFSALKPWR